MNSNITVRVVVKNYLKEEKKKTRQKGHTNQKARTKKKHHQFSSMFRIHTKQ